MRKESRLLRAEDGTGLHIQLNRSGTPRAPSCLLLHGFGDGAYVWDDTCAALGNLCSTVAVDLRGHGDSERARSGAYDLQTNVRDATMVIKQLGLSPLIIVGHSFGGEIALRLAARPVVSTIAGIFVDASPEPNQEAATRATAVMLEGMRTYPSIEEYAANMMSMRPLLHEAMALQLARRALRASEEGFRLKLDPVLAEHADDVFTTTIEWHELLRMIRCPTLVVRGAASAMTSVSSSREMTSLLRRARLVTIPCAGHAVMSDNSTAFIASVTGFVKSLLSTPPR